MQTEPPMNAPENREQTAEIMFEGLNIQGIPYKSHLNLVLFKQAADDFAQDFTLLFRRSLPWLPAGLVTK